MTAVTVRAAVMPHPPSVLACPSVLGAALHMARPALSWPSALRWPSGLAMVTVVLAWGLLQHGAVCGQPVGHRGDVIGVLRARPVRAAAVPDRAAAHRASRRHRLAYC